MRKAELINSDWKFVMPGRQTTTINVPHTWNGIDGQDGGNNYLRTACRYVKEFARPAMEDGEACLVRFNGVNSECEVFFNGEKIFTHEGGYSAFNVDLSGKLKDNNILEVAVSNRKNNRVYPQKADFTFYGGIYRDVYLITLPKDRFEFGPDSSPPLKLKTDCSGTKGILTATVYNNIKGVVSVSVYDDGTLIAKGKAGEPIEIEDVHLWDGVKDPFMYTVKAQLYINGRLSDEVSAKTGFRSYRVDPEKGFFLNGKAYPLRGVCRHQDRPKIGNALNKSHHDEDMELITEVGATTVRLAHYQHDQYFYDLCDEKGIVVWAEIPYISQHLPTANQNALDQMRELIRQNFNHPSIVCWGISNEITISRISSDTVECHKRINELCHQEDPGRFTVVAGYMAITKGNRTLHVSDVVSYNLYFGWYLPFTGLTGVKLDAFRKKYPDTPLGLSEYGAEAMPNLHSRYPMRGDNTEDYQAIYHEKILKIIEQRDYLWATHVWNMFDFAADARNQGGEPGMNHKGLVTFDRKTRKDSFYLYKAYWSKQPFVHISGRRYANRTGKTTVIKAYSNQSTLELYVNGRLVGSQTADKVFKFKINMEESNNIEIKCGELTDKCVINRVKSKDRSYKIKKTSNKSWEK